MEDQGRKLNLAPWIIFLVASILILIIVNSMLNYAPSASGGTVFDAVGAILPYILLATIVAYHLLRSNMRSFRLTLRGTGRHLQRTLKLTLLMIGFLFLIYVTASLALVIIGLIGLRLEFGGSSATTGPIVSGTPGEVSPTTIDLWSFLSIFLVGFTLATLLVVTFLGKRRRDIEATESDEELEAVSIAFSANRFIDDDYRKAILSYYSQGREHMVKQGVPLTEAMTPREFEKNVLNSIRVAGKNFTSLTYLFEEARFSIHQIGKSEESKAKLHYEKLKKISSDEEIAKVE